MTEQEYADALLGAALEYVDAGLYVFPARVERLENGKKRSQFIASWREASSNSPEQVRAWWGPGGAWRGAHVCLDCGKSQIVVVDADGQEGLDSLAALNLPATPVAATTPTNGLHVYFRENPRKVVGNTGRTIAPGIDTRGLGGLVFAAPSRDAAGAYVWRGVPDFLSLPVVPDVITDRCREASATTGVISPVFPGEQVSTGGAQVEPGRQDQQPFDLPPRQFTEAQAITFCKPYLDALRAAQPGEINIRLNDAAKVLSHFIGPFWSETDARAWLHNALKPTAYDGATWKADDTIASAFRSSARDWRAELVTDPFATTAPGTTPAPASSRVVDLAPYLDGTYTPPIPSVGAERDDGHRLLYPGRWHVLVGLTGAGKSWHALWHAVETMRADQKVVYAHFEEHGPGGTLDRLNSLGADKDMIREHFIWLDCSTRWQAGEFATALGQACPFPPALVVLDGINAAVSQHGGDVQRTESIGQYRGLFVNPAVATGAAVLSLGHPVKDRTRQGERHSFGSTAWLDEVDGVGFRLEASAKNPISRGRNGAASLYSVKDRYGQVERLGVHQDGREPGWFWQGQFVLDDSKETIGTTVRLTTPRSPERDSEAKDELDLLGDAMLATLAKRQSDDVFTRPDLMARLRSDGEKFTDALASAALMRLAERGKIDLDTSRKPWVGKIAAPSEDQKEE